MSQREACDRFEKLSQTIASGGAVPKVVAYSPHCKGICLNLSSDLVLDMRKKLIDALSELARSVDHPPIIILRPSFYVSLNIIYTTYFQT